mmetsp:Transcript_97367/g.275230  ORF Transcript_97367/g.275230 Transcript_97367/m.275230 type:complete len:206 (+) Transcript_97367:1702-2319(+)
MPFPLGSPFERFWKTFNLRTLPASSKICTKSAFDNSESALLKYTKRLSKTPLALAEGSSLSAWVRSTSSSWDKRRQVGRASTPIASSRLLRGSCAVTGDRPLRLFARFVPASRRSQMGAADGRGPSSTSLRRAKVSRVPGSWRAVKRDSMPRLPSLRPGVCRAPRPWPSLPRPGGRCWTSAGGSAVVGRLHGVGRDTCCHGFCPA